MKRKRFIIIIKEIIDSVFYSSIVFCTIIIFVLLYRGDKLHSEILDTLLFIGDLLVKYIIILAILALIKRIIVTKDFRFNKNSMVQNEIKKLSSSKIIFMGQLIVNLPITIIIFASTIIFMQFDFSFNLSLIISILIGWYFWEKLLQVWKKWAFSKNVSPERLFKLGKQGLINYFRSRIFD